MFGLGHRVASPKNLSRFPKDLLEERLPIWQIHLAVLKRITFLLLFCLGGPSYSEEAASVYDISPARDISFTAAGLLGAAVPYIFEGQWVRPRCPCNVGEINGFDRGSVNNRSYGALVLTDVVLGVAMAGPPVLDLLDVGWGNVFLEDMLVYTQTLATSAALVSITKTIFQRPIPRSYAGDPSVINDPSGYRSFYSGHVSMTVAALSAAAFTMNLRHKNGAWPWIVVGVLGTTACVGRVLGGAHFPSDVIVGAAMGVGVGTLIPMLHIRPNKAANIVFLSPVPGGAQLMFMSRL